MSVVPNTAVDLRGAFLHDCDEEAEAGAFRRLGPSQTAFAQAPRGIAWHRTPSTYLVCTEDRATPPARQREFARRASRQIDLSTGHHPFLSHPGSLAEVIGEIAERLGAPTA